MRVVLLFLAFQMLTAGCRRSPAAPPPPPACPTCAQAKLTNKWCDKCQIGYVAGVPIECKILFETLDAHGHELVLSAIDCPDCQAAIRTDGFCEKCRIGWVHNLAYFSRLTYHLAKGTPSDPARISCLACRRNARKYGWCDSCGAGMIGNVAIRNRNDFAGGCRGYDLMMSAIEASKRCEVCALVILTDTSCFRCKKQYKDGKVVPPPPR